MSEYFEEKYQKIIKNNNILETRIKKSLKHLTLDPFYPSLNSHKVDLSNFGVVYSSWVTGDIRIIWEYGTSKDTIHLLNIGGHSGKNSAY